MSKPTRLTVSQPLEGLAAGTDQSAKGILSRLQPGVVFMMGDNPALPRMPDQPRLLDFFRLRFGDITVRHLLQRASWRWMPGTSEKMVLACLLHDISNGA